jgi:hypothetical protein
MKEAKRQLFEQTKEIWQPHPDHVLTDEDARQITQNIIGFFRILQEWEEKEGGK